MPIYEYTCKKCENCFDILVFSSDEEPVACPDCGGENVDRIMSCTGVIRSSGNDSCSSRGPGGFS